MDAQKAKIKERIETLILATEENRKHLLSFLEATNDPEKLKRLELLVNDEEKALLYFMKSVADAAVEAGDGNFLKQLDQMLKEGTKIMRKEAEVGEQETEETEAEEVLKQMD